MHILGDIDRYLKRTGCTASRFGREAAGDPRLVRDLRRGRQPGEAMLARLRAFLDAAGADGAAR